MLIKSFFLLTQLDAATVVVIIQRGRTLATGESVLIHAAGSGVGTAAIQLASLAGCRSFGTAGSDDILQRAADLGLDIGINYHNEDFSKVISIRFCISGLVEIKEAISLSVLTPRARIRVTTGRSTGELGSLT